MVSKQPQNAPGPANFRAFGNLYHVRSAPLSFFQAIVRDYGDYVSVRFGPFRYIVVNHPDGIRQILVDKHRNYPKSRTYMALKLILGEGLLTSEGDFWRRQRRLAQPAFHKERLSSFARAMVGDTAAMLERWSDSDSSAPFDLHQEMMHLTFKIVSRTLFSAETSADADAVGKALTVTIDHVNEVAGALIAIPAWVPTPRNIRFKRAKRTLDSLVFRIIDERRRSGREVDDLLSMLMSARDEETREQMTDTQLRDEIMTIVLAGHETTANALTWAFYLLSQHPDIAEQVRREATSVLAGRAPTVEDLPRLALTRMVIEEAMRLYPPAWEFERQALADDELGGYRVPRGTTVAISPYMMHRHPRYWDNPDTFDPYRFTPERAAGRPKYTYLPFGGGPRLCIGNSFAMMEAQIILAMVASRWSLELSPGFSVELEPTVTLRPRRGLFMQRKPRTPMPEGEARRAEGVARA